MHLLRTRAPRWAAIGLIGPLFLTFRTRALTCQPGHLLAQQVQRRGERCVGDPPRRAQLGAKVIDRRLVGSHRARPAAFGDCGGDGWIESGFQRQSMMRPPLELSVPGPRGDQDGELVEACADRGCAR